MGKSTKWTIAVLAGLLAIYASVMAVLSQMQKFDVTDPFNFDLDEDESI